MGYIGDKHYPLLRCQISHYFSVRAKILVCRLRSHYDFSERLVTHHGSKLFSIGTDSQKIKRHGIRDRESVKNKTLCKETIDNRSIDRRTVLSCAGGPGDD